MNITVNINIEVFYQQNVFTDDYTLVKQMILTNKFNGYIDLCKKIYDLALTAADQNEIFNSYMIRGFNMFTLSRRDTYGKLVDIRAYISLSNSELANKNTSKAKITDFSDVYNMLFLGQG